MAKKCEISIIGPGKVGTALGFLAGRAGWPIVAVGGRDIDRARAAAETIASKVRYCSLHEAAAAGQLLLLTVRDDAIRPLCSELAVSGVLRPGTIIAHCCGALDSEILSAARDRCGCFIASCHPLQTFPTVESAIDRLPGSHFFCEGDKEALVVLEELITDIGARSVPILSGADRKSLYHAGAVMGCNYLTAMIDASLSLMTQAGIDRNTALAALQPLVLATIENVFAMGPEEALTGPIARGDVDTVRQHLEAMGGLIDLPGGAEIMALYSQAGRRTVDMAKRKGKIDDSVANALYELLRA